jgi:DNA-binding NarL/FixJ family response regulator
MVVSGVRNGTIRVLIVDDEPDLRLLLRTMLTLDQRFEIAGEGTDGGEALMLFEQLRPDVLLLDQRMPVLTGLDVARRVLDEHPDQAVILLSAYLNDAVKAEAAALGVRGVIGKEHILDLGPEILRLVS